MPDRALFTLDTEARWQLAFDANQWVIRHRTQKPRTRRLDGHAITDSGWRGMSYIGSTKRILRRVLGERSIVLTLEARAQLDALPEQFADFIVTTQNRSRGYEPSGKAKAARGNRAAL